MDKGEWGGCLWIVVLGALGWWIAQPDTGRVCVTEQHWWIATKLPTCAEEIDDLQSRVSALEERLHTAD